MFRHIAFIGFILCFAQLAYSQSISDVNRPLELTGTHVIDDITDHLEDHFGVYLVYSATVIDGTDSLSLRSGVTLVQLLDHICTQHATSYTVTGNRVVFRKVVPEILVKGRIFDSQSREYLPSVVVEDVVTKKYTFSNDFGYFSIKIPKDHALALSHIGYKSDTLMYPATTGEIYYMEGNLSIQTVLIKESTEASHTAKTGSRLISSDTWSVVESEILNDNIDDIIRKQGVVQSGSEGQTGFYVKGGSPDQNLILIDNMHIYEASHTFGLNSIFIKQALKQLELNAEGMPARYGDRISAVLNATLKQGDKGAHNGHLSLSLDDAIMQADGPLSKSGRTTYNIAGRTSLYDLYVPALINEFTSYSSGEINYYDIYAKLSHRFTSTSSTSLTMYQGGDLFRLERIEKNRHNEDDYQVDTRSKLKWNNRLWAFNYDNILSSKVHFHFDAGLIDYKQSSEGYFGFYSDETSFLKFQAIVFSGNSDRKASAYIDYYHDDHHRFKAGGEYLVQNMNPALQQFDSLANVDMLILNNKEPKFSSKSYSLFVEDTYTSGIGLTVYAGLRLSQYLHEKTYVGWQPRLRLRYDVWKGKITLIAAYARNLQYSHLLVNSGLGLPSDLWVPSTSSIRPQRSHNFDFSLEANVGKGLKINVSAYRKNLTNVIEYDDDVSIYFIDVFSRGVLDFDTADRWQEHVFQGRGKAYGVSVGGKYLSSNFAAWAQYTYAREKRIFDQINDGREFRYRYDRPHDINVGLWIRLGERWSVSSKFVYTSGNTFSLAIEGYEGVLGLEVTNAGKRNNFRMPPYHRLDFSAKYTHVIDRKQSLDVVFGVNNAYNRSNGQYAYIYSDPLSEKRTLRLVSLFPILPRCRITYSF